MLHFADVDRREITRLTATVSTTIVIEWTVARDWLTTRWGGDVMTRLQGPLLGLALLAASSAHATPITVTGGKTVIFSFDFTSDGVIPPPPYPDIRIQTGLLLSSFDPGVDDCRYTFFGDVNGVGQGSSVRSCAIDTFESAFDESGWLDGLFSISLTAISGSITVDPHAMAFDAFGLNGRPMTPGVRPGIRVVPEPWSIAVLLAGLATMVLFRARPVRARRERILRVDQKR